MRPATSYCFSSTRGLSAPPLLRRSVLLRPLYRVSVAATRPSALLPRGRRRRDGKSGYSPLLESVLVPEKLDEVLRGLADEWTSQTDVRAVQRDGLEADLVVVEAELRNLTAALAGGAAVASVLDG